VHRSDDQDSASPATSAVVFLQGAAAALAFVPTRPGAQDMDKARSSSGRETARRGLRCCGSGSPSFVAAGVGCPGADYMATLARDAGFSGLVVPCRQARGVRHPRRRRPERLGVYFAATSSGTTRQKAPPSRAAGGKARPRQGHRRPRRRTNAGTADGRPRGAGPSRLQEGRGQPRADLRGREEIGSQLRAIAFKPEVEAAWKSSASSSPGRSHPTAPSR
jgi:hypothetical protein